MSKPTKIKEVYTADGVNLAELELPAYVVRGQGLGFDVVEVSIVRLTLNQNGVFADLNGASASVEDREGGNGRCVPLLFADRAAALHEIAKAYRERAQKASADADAHLTAAEEARREAARRHDDVEPAAPPYCKNLDELDRAFDELDSVTWAEWKNRAERRGVKVLDDDSGLDGFVLTTAASAKAALRRCTIYFESPF